VDVTSLPFNASVDVTDATIEPNEPLGCGFPPNTAWYSVTPTETIKVRVDTQGSAIAGNISIYHAADSGFPDLQFIQCTGFGGATTLLAEGGETYYLQVGGLGEAGTIQVNLTEMSTISGRVTDAVTGTALPGDTSPFALVTLQRVCGEGCFEFVNSQFADSAGRFLFDSYYYGAPLSIGSYRLEVSANLYVTTGFGPFEFIGTKLDLGDVPVSPPGTIRGRAVDADTGSPLAGTAVTLYRCSAADCTEFVNSQNTDGSGLFLFNSFYYGAPLPGGTYQLGFSDGLHEARQIEVVVSNGADHNLGDVALTPLPLIGSISGKLVDKVTGKPVPQAFMPTLALHRCTNGDCSEFVNSLVPDSLGRFRFDVDYYGNPIPVGTFQIRAYADQYQEFQGDPFTVGQAEHKNVGNIRLTSFPIRFSEIRVCSEIPAAGGDCVYSVKITNGLPTKLEGSAWSLVSGYLPDSFAGYTDFQPGDKQELGLDPGKSRTLQFRFIVPANRSSYGTFICTQVFVGKGNNSTFNTIGFRDLFCVLRNATGFAIASLADMTSMQETSIPAATGIDIEPNNSCQSAQDLSAQPYPFVLNGELDSSQNPDVDFFRFTGTPGLLATIDLEGQATGKGTLGDPYLGFFDSNCNLIATDDDGGESLNSRLEITIPDDGVFVLAATLCCDGGFAGGGSGSYQLTVAPVQFLGSISGLVTDAVSGKPLRGDVLPYANVGLLHCTQFGCSGVNNQAAGADGRFNFTSDYSGAPLRVGNYLVIVNADQYEPYQVDAQNVGEAENRDLGNIPLTSYPVRFSDFQGCDIPSGGDVCEFSVKITNGLSKRFAGKAWSLIYGSGTGSLINFTHFQTNTPLDVSLDPGKGRTLRFRFRVREQVADGAVICATVYVGQNPNAHFNTVGRADLFCVVKGSTGFTLMSEQDMHTHLQQMQILEAAPTTTPSLSDK
jgi:5-hydroxyisourate hydrolase-like protein (transthyretin family)